MKKLSLLLFSVMMTVGLMAQVKTPAPSPSSKLVQDVGLTTVTIEYSRPGVKERKIFGGLVPYNEYWRTGANAGTEITFSEDVMIGDQDLEKGTYTLFTKPGKESWEIVFYKDLSINVPPSELDEEMVALTLNVRPIMVENSVESMTFDIGELRDDSALITLNWADVVVPIPLRVHTDKQVIASIDDAMDGPSANEYRNAAKYYLNTDRDLDKALMWINKSLEMNPGKFWVLRDKSHIQAAMGNYKDAIATAKESMMAAEEAGNSQYVKFNKESIEEWSMKLK